MVHFRKISGISMGSSGSHHNNMDGMAHNTSADSKNNNNNNNNNHKREKSMKLSKEDESKFKIRTASVNDPILDAVQEAQPFEQAAATFKDNENRLSYFQGEDGSQMRRTDVFGNTIHNPDMSNPARSRDERPMDTIRGFEYSISHDPYWGQNLETPYYGFKVRPENHDYLYRSHDINAFSDIPFQQEQPIYQSSREYDEFEQKSKPKKSRFFWKNKK